MAIKAGGHCCLDCRSWHNAESSGQDGRLCSAIAVSHCEGLVDTLCKTVGTGHMQCLPVKVGGCG